MGLLVTGASSPLYLAVYGAEGFNILAYLVQHS